jgi:hypothetical protein
LPKLEVKFYYSFPEHLVILINFLLLISGFNDSLPHPSFAKCVSMALLARGVSMAIKKLWLWIKKQKQCAEQKRDEVMPLNCDSDLHFAFGFCNAHTYKCMHSCIILIS